MRVKEKKQDIVGNKYVFKTTNGDIEGVVTNAVNVGDRKLYVMSSTNTGKDYLLSKVRGTDKVKLLGVTSPYMFRR